MPEPAAPPELLEAYERCRRFTRRRAANFYLAFAILPPPRRRAIYAVYAYAGTIDDAVDDAESDERRRAALSRAKTLLDCAYGDGEPHPRDAWLTEALGDAVRRFDIPRGHFEELAAGMEQDLTQDRYADFGELEAYCYRAASVIGLICIEIFGYRAAERETATARAIAMGKALQITNIMRDVREDAERGRIYLALDDMRRHGVEEADVLAGRTTDGFRALMAEYAERAYGFYAEGERLLPLLPERRSRMCCNGLQGVYRVILDAIVAADYDVFARRISPSKPGRAAKLLQLWASAARPSR